MSPALPTADGIAYRAAGPEDGPAALLLHGFPESSRSWAATVDALGAAGMRAVAPDLPGFGATPPDGPGTWERQVENVERFRSALGLGDVALGVHDWGGLIGLRWACEHPGAVRALVISSTGFFPDGKWNALAKVMRAPGEGEQFMENVTRDLLAAGLRAASPGLDDATVDEYWRSLADPERRAAALELYRSGDFEKLARYDGQLAALNVPTLLLWGAADEFAPVAGAKRLEAELPQTTMVVHDDLGHFLLDEDGPRVADDIVAFMRGAGLIPSP